MIITFSFGLINHTHPLISLKKRTGKQILFLKRVQSKTGCILDWILNSPFCMKKCCITYVANLGQNSLRQNLSVLVFLIFPVGRSTGQRSWNQNQHILDEVGAGVELGNNHQLVTGCLIYCKYIRHNIIIQSTVFKTGFKDIQIVHTEP